MSFLTYALVYFVFAMLSIAISVHSNPSKLELPKKRPNPVGKDGLPLFRCGTIWMRGDEKGWSSCQREATRFWISTEEHASVYCRCGRCPFGNVSNGRDATREEASDLVVVQQIMLEDEIG
jgi:hypothetical protein